MAMPIEYASFRGKGIRTASSERHQAAESASASTRHAITGGADPDEKARRYNRANRGDRLCD
jgi:hypothetical protein